MSSWVSKFVVFYKIKSTCSSETREAKQSVYNITSVLELEAGLDFSQDRDKVVRCEGKHILEMILCLPIHQGHGMAMEQRKHTPVDFNSQACSKLTIMTRTQRRVAGSHESSQSVGRKPMQLTHERH